MKEQSHKSEMSAAVRGDFDRLRARRGEPTEDEPPLPDPAAASDPAPPPEPHREPDPELPPAAVAEREPVAAPASAAAPRRRAFLDRLRGRG